MRPFSLSDARRYDVPYERMRRRDLAIPFAGVRDHADRPVSTLSLCRAYATKMRRDAVFTHFTAAELWGLPLPPATAGEAPRLHVSLPSGSRAVRSRGVTGHHLRFADGDVSALCGIPVTSPARTWCDLAGRLPLDRLVAAGDRLLWRRDPLCTSDELLQTLRSYAGRRGRVDRRTAIALLTDRADSAPESLLRARIIAAGLPRPRPNPVLHRADGTVLGMPDLAFPGYRMALEYEGDHHRTEAAQWRADIRRVADFEDEGWHVTRATALDLAHGSRPLLARLARRLRERGWTPPPPLGEKPKYVA